MNLLKSTINIQSSQDFAINWTGLIGEIHCKGIGIGRFKKAFSGYSRNKFSRKYISISFFKLECWLLMLFQCCVSADAGLLWELPISFTHCHAKQKQPWKKCKKPTKPNCCKNCHAKQKQPWKKCKKPTKPNCCKNCQAKTKTDLKKMQKANLT